MAALLPRFKARLSRIHLVPSDGGRFEISLDGTLIYSKLKTQSFPEHEAIIQEIEARLR
jgi:selenoprotein W-related protein